MNVILKTIWGITISISSGIIYKIIYKMKRKKTISIINNGYYLGAGLSIIYLILIKNLLY